MKVYEAYRLAIEAGMSRDPRPEPELRRILDSARSEYDSAPESERELFDAERLWNPYYDCRFSCGAEEAMEAEAERLMWGIDVGTGEVLLADRLREKGQRIDALVAHHPLGSSRVLFPKVMDVQADMYHAAGVPINVSEDIMRPRTAEALRSVMGVNHNQAVDAAKLLGIPLFNVHSAADNMVQDYLTKLMESKEPRTLGDIVDVLMAEPEYREAARSNARPAIMVGSKDSRCGRILCKMTGGTSGPKDMYEALSRAGVGTVIGMHFPESHYEAAREAHVNLVVSGHMPSDSLGINLICDIWENEGIEVLPCSGFIRCSRNRDVRAEVIDHTRRVEARLRLRAQEPGAPRGADGRPGDAVPPARRQQPRVHRVPDRQRGDRQDGHGQQVLRGHGRVHGGAQPPPGRRLRQLQERLRGGGAPPDHQALRPRVPREGVLLGGDGPGHGAASGGEQPRPGGRPGRGGRAAQEGPHRHSLPAHPRPHRADRPGLPDPDRPGCDRRLPRRGVALVVPQVEHGQVQQVQRDRAQGDSRRPRGGGADPRHDDRRRPRPHRGAVRRVRRRQDGDRAAGPRGEHRRGRRRGRGHPGARQGRQGHDIQRRLGIEAQDAGRQQEDRPPRRGEGDEEQPQHHLGGGREDLRDSVRGVRGAREEAHPVLDVPQGPGQDRRHPRDRGQGRDREGLQDLPAGHTVEGPGAEDGGPPRGDRR